MILNKIQCDGVYLCAIIEEGHAALSINPYPGYIFDPISSVEGIGIQEGSVCMVPYALGSPSWDTFGLDTLTSGVWGPFYGTIPSFWFKWVAVLDAFTSGHLWIKCSGLLQW